MYRVLRVLYSDKHAFYANQSARYTALNYNINISIKHFPQWYILYTRDLIFRATEEQMKLMEYQVKLEEKYRKTFMDLSLSDTIYQVR